MGEFSVADLKPDDVVGILPRPYGAGMSMDTRQIPLVAVSHTTATQVVLKDGSRWTHRNRRVGESSGAWSGSSRLISADDARQRNEERAVERARQHMIYQLQETKWAKLPTDVLARVIGVLDAATKAEAKSGES